MNKILILLSVTLMLFIAGCGEAKFNDAEEKAATTTSEEAKDVAPAKVTETKPSTSSTTTNVERKTCTDSDGGINTDEWGKVIDSNGDLFTDECANLKTVTEYSCDSLGNVKISEITCPEICKSGKCYVAEKIEGCADPDLGPDAKYVRTIVVDDTGSYEDYCSSSDRVGEYYCNRFGSHQEDKLDCPNGCVDGACLE